jgi:hypothetical protein
MYHVIMCSVAWLALSDWYYMPSRAQGNKHYPGWEKRTRKKMSEKKGQEERKTGRKEKY